MERSLLFYILVAILENEKISPEELRKTMEEALRYCGKE